MGRPCVSYGRHTHSKAALVCGITSRLSRGRPKLRYKDTLKASMKDCLIDPDTWEQTASNRPAWRQQVWKGASHYEQSRIAKKKDQRRRRKQKEANCLTWSCKVQSFMCLWAWDHSFRFERAAQEALKSCPDLTFLNLLFLFFVDLHVNKPCKYCMNSFQKIVWESWPSSILIGLLLLGGLASPLLDVWHPSVSRSTARTLAFKFSF